MGDAPGPALPRLMLIADGFASGRGGRPAEAVQACALRLVNAGVEAVQLRDHAASAAAFGEAAAAFAARLRARRPDLVLLVNTHADVASALGAGLHVGRRGPAVATAREHLGPGPLLGYSAHSPEAAQRAVEARANYVFFSPVFATPSHPEAAPAGLEALTRTCAAVPGVPVYALGGLTPERTRASRAAGAYGVAVLSALLDAPAPLQALRAFLRALA